MKTLKLLLIIFTISFSFTSCDLNDESSMDGDDIVSGQDIIVGWTDASVTESYFADTGVIAKNYPVEVLGGGDGSPTTQDIAVTFTVDPSTTAVGGEYVLNTSSATLLSGQTFVNIPIGISTGDFSPTEPTKLVLDLQTSVDGVVISSLAQKMTINFVGCQSTIADFTYLVTTTREDGAVYGPAIETMLMESVNNFMSYSVGSWSSPLNPGHGVRFGDICGSLTIPDQALADMYGNDVTGDAVATVEANGDFTLRYTISFGTGPLKHVGTYIKQ